MYSTTLGIKRKTHSIDCGQEMSLTVLSIEYEACFVNCRLVMYSIMLGIEHEAHSVECGQKMNSTITNIA